MIMALAMVIVCFRVGWETVLGYQALRQLESEVSDPGLTAAQGLALEKCEVVGWRAVGCWHERLRRWMPG